MTFSKEEPCSIWDDVEVSPANIRVASLQHSHLQKPTLNSTQYPPLFLGSARSKQLKQFDIKVICDQPVEGAIDVLSPEFSVWGRFYVQSVLGKLNCIEFQHKIQFCFCFAWSSSSLQRSPWSSTPTLRFARPLLCTWTGWGWSWLLWWKKKTYLFQHFSFWWLIFWKLTSTYALQDRPVLQRRNL